MARNTDHGGGFEPDDSGGLLGGFLADEDGLDRRALWRIGSWGFAATGAVVLAVMENGAVYTGEISVGMLCPSV